MTTRFVPLLAALLLLALSLGLGCAERTAGRARTDIVLPIAAQPACVHELELRDCKASNTDIDPKSCKHVYVAYDRACEVIKVTQAGRN